MDIIPPQSPRLEQAPPTSPEPTHTPSSPPPKSKNGLRPVFSTIGLFLSAFIIAILLNTFVIQSYQVDGESMQNTLHNNDRLIVDKIPRTWSRITGHQYVPKRGQIIIFNQSNLPGFVGEKQLVKRVIGLPGERVVVNDGHITIYNAQHPKGFNPDTSGLYHIDATTTPGNVDVTLKSDQLFVCGDNRTNSEDSRYFGPIETNQVIAKLILRILPLDKAKGF
ncbi:MAG TPA: signal peptidase I [Candidatus Saccharimonadales bacterium]|nr:signal peptidase I [Candidatus Saccharimonadales bacterium]